MKKIVFLISIIFTINAQLISQSCLPDGISLYTQEMIDNFPTNYPDCTEIEGSLFIHGDLINNLDSLIQLTKIGELLEIDFCSSLTNLSGLDNLTTVGLDLYFHENSGLTSLSGLENLTSIGRDLYIGWNHNLSSISGLQNLNTIGRDAFIWGGESLTSLSGLEELSTIGGYLDIKSTSLTNLSGLNGLTIVGGTLRIQNNDNLINLNGISNLIKIGWTFEIQENSTLINLSGLDNLRFIGGTLLIENNTVLTSLYGLNNLDTIISGLRLENNHQLESIIDLQGVTVLAGNINIKEADKLTSLVGLENINPEYINQLLLYGNDSLSFCEITSICNYLGLPDAQPFISYNAPGCNNLEEIESACESLNIEDFDKNALFKILPNPARNKITITNTDRLQLKEFIIYNQIGQTVVQQNGVTNFVDVSSLEQGIYIIEFVTIQKRIRKKLIIKR